MKFNIGLAKYGVLIVVFTTPFVVPIAWLTGFSISGKSWHNVVTLALAFYVFTIDSLKKGTTKINIIDKIIIVFMVWGIFIVLNTYIHTGNIFRALQGFRLYFWGITLYYVIRKSFIHKNDIKLFSYTLHAVVLIVSLELFWEYFSVISGRGFSLIPWVAEVYLRNIEPFGEYNKGGQIEGFSRPFGILFQITVNALLILVGSLLSLSYLLSNRHSHSRSKINFYILVVFLIEVVAIVISTSKRTIVAFIILSALMSIGYKASRKIILFAVLIGVLLYIVVSEPLLGFFKSTYVEEHYTAVFSVDKLFSVDIDIGTFFVGNGFAQTASEGETGGEGLSTLGDVDLGVVGYYITELSQFGIVGILILIFLNVTAVKKAFMLAKHKTDSHIRSLYIGCSFVMIGFIITTTTQDFIVHTGIHYIYYAFLGVISSALEFSKKQHD